MKRRVVWIASAVALVAIAGAGYWRHRAKHRSRHAAFKTAPVERRDIVGRVTASGTLTGVVTVQVGTQVSGRIQTLFADYNSQVKKGQPVAKIEPLLFEAAERQSRANYMSAKAGVAAAKANAANAEKQCARTRALRADSLASQADLDGAEANLAVVRASVQAAEASMAQAAAQLKQAQVNLSFTTIVSPIDGVVISRTVDTGQTVAAALSSPTLFTIAQDLTKMQVDTNIAEGDVGRLRVGMQTYFTVDSFPGQTFRGSIRQIRNAPTTVQNVVTYDAVIDVDNDDLRLRPGMTANVTVIYDQRQEALAVPNAALRFRPPAWLLEQNGEGAGRWETSGDDGGAPAAAAPEGVTIWVLRRGMAHPAAVKPGLSDGAVTELASGHVKEGDPVVIDAVDPAAAPSAAGAAVSMRRLF
jgi:HlyD family secretion protein